MQIHSDCQKLRHFALNERDARENARAFIKEYKDIFPRLVDCIKKDLDSCIAYMKQPFRRWKHIRTTNIIERGFKEVKRRVKVMETFRTFESCQAVGKVIFFSDPFMG